jgi:hypothetical protein
MGSAVASNDVTATRCSYDSGSGQAHERELAKQVEPLASVAQQIERENSQPLESLRTLGYIE